MDDDDARRRFAAARVAVLGTLGSGRPHLVPVVFALLSPDVIVTAVDHKRKSSRRLQRLANIAATPEVSLLAHEFDEDWTQLWWVRADGEANVKEDPPALAHAQRALAAKYPIYARTPPAGPVIEVSITRWVGWTAT